jgi:hypothetical protein
MDQNRIVGIVKDAVFHKDPDTGTEAPARPQTSHRAAPIPA